MKYVGVDIGGTKINVVLIDETGKLFFQKQFPTPKTKKELLDEVVKTLYLFPQNDVRGIGIGVPGTLNKEMSKIISLPNLSILNGFALKKFIEKKMNKEVRLDNDVNCLALYSLWFGHGKTLHNFVCITLGTGVGGGIIINRALYRGRGNAAEWGHMTLDLHKKGRNGEFEEFVAKPGFSSAMKKEGFSHIDGFIELEKKMLKGNKKAKKVVESVGRYLGVGISNVIHCFDPELVVMGGGLAHYGDVLFNAARKEAQARTFFPIPPIKLCKNLRHGGAIGAACLFLK